MTTKKNNQFVSNFKKKYIEQVIPFMIEQFKYKNKMEVPRVSHVVINMGIGDAKDNPKKLESAIREMTIIAAQKPVITKSRQDISNFKIRQGYPVGCKVTLRGTRMYDFMERLVSIALPRTRDFRGLSFKSFDGRGNYSFGVKEQIIFTEINYDEIDSIRGMDITFATTAKTNDESYWLLKSIGLPLRDKPVKQEEVSEAA